ncbi:MAG: hypothetical protein ACYC27_16255 [Armatimonadota bacterium]
MQEELQDDYCRMPPHVPEVASVLAEGILRMIKSQMSEIENNVHITTKQALRGDQR